MNEEHDLYRPDDSFFVAFDGSTMVASGELIAVVRQVKQRIDGKNDAAVLIFEDANSEVVDIDFRGAPDEVIERFLRREALHGTSRDLVSAVRQQQTGAGRPKLGVVPREVTLLPRHWDWLNRQPGGASVALRKLVDEARKVSGGKDLVRESQETAYRFMSAIGGDLPGFEEALRALYAGDRVKFQKEMGSWPSDIRAHASKLADRAFTAVADSRL